MCIKDNPRYINLIKMGMPDIDICVSYNVYYYKIFEKYPHMRYLWRAQAGRINALQYFQLGETPEEAINKLFTILEEYYDTHQ